MSLYKYATEEDFNNAPLGHPFMESCGCCGEETGCIVIKKTGNGVSGKDRFSIPKYMVNPESRCEFCEVLGMWLGQEGLDPKETGLKYGVAKIVYANGEEEPPKLLAYVPFSSAEDHTTMIKPEGEDAVEIELKHRMIILCENESGGDMRKVLDAGV